MATNKDSNATKETAAKKDSGATEDVQVATSYDFSAGDAVTLIVGPEQKHMLVHGTYLTRGSDFFKAALKKEWVEGETRVIKLPEEDPETMAHYMTFVYCNKLPFDGIQPRKKEHFALRWSILIDLYVYGERFPCQVIQDAAVKEILRLTRVTCSNGSLWFPIGTNVEKVYGGTPEGSPLRRLMVDMHVIRGCKEWLGTPDAYANPRFLMDVVQAFYDRMSNYKAFGEFRFKELDDERYLSKV
jgi:hypothetical protein